MIPGAVMHQQWPCGPFYPFKPRCAEIPCPSLTPATTWPIPCQQQQHQRCCGPAQGWQHGSGHPGAARRRWRSTTVCSAGSCRPETACVVEYLLLLQAMPDTQPEEMEILLDSLWSLQYMIPSVMCAAAGTVTSCTLHTDLQQQQQQQWSPPPAASNGGGSGSRSEQQAPDVLPPLPQPQPPLAPGMFTHAVHFRLSCRPALEAFLAHPLMAAVQEQVNEACSSSAHIVFEGRVAKRLEALFRRGEEFGSGVEHVLLLQPGSNGGLGADEFLQQLAALAESSVAGGIQSSYGAVVSCVHTAATHVLMTRFGAAQQVQQLLATPACAAVLQGDPRLPVVAASSLAISIQPTEESTRVDGSGLRGS